MGSFCRGIKREMTESSGIPPEGADPDRVYLPRLAQSAHSRVAHPHNDGEEGIQILKLPTTVGKHTIRPKSSSDEACATQHALVRDSRRCVCVWATHCAAILMNFLRSCTLLLSWLHRQTSVTTHSWTWLNLCRNRSRLAVVLLKFCRPKVWYSSSCWEGKHKKMIVGVWTGQLLLLHNDASLIFFHVNAQPWGGAWPHACSWRVPSQTWSSGRPDPSSSSAQRWTWSLQRDPLGLEDESDAQTWNFDSVKSSIYMLDRGIERMKSDGGLCMGHITASWFSNSTKRGNISYQTAELLSGTCKQSAVDAQSRKHWHVIGLQDLFFCWKKQKKLRDRSDFRVDSRSESRTKSMNEDC